jgi:signal transduction histidine kinase
MFERIAVLLGMTLATHRTQAALVERVKELTCLHGVAHAVGRQETDIREILQEVLPLLPPAWQYPDVAQGRIVLDGRTCATPRFGQARACQSTDIVVRGDTRGKVEIAYIEDRPSADEGPFLAEERALIDSVARELSSLVERQTIEEERARLQDHLNRADRLATIGQLSAGVAHELNEPLASILGFAQLCRKHPGLPAPAVADLDKIIAATLHAREVVRKLMLFARERPPAREWIALRRIIDEGVAFVESRARKAGVEIRRDISADLPEILADPSLLCQVLVNLLVNSIQAMPEGGTLDVEAYPEESGVVLAVEDDGAGVPPEVAERIFEPFFTTKGVDEGTGLGLSVVQGIVTGHGGTIRVHSAPGEGARFEVWLPVDPPEVSFKAQ